MCKTIFVIFLMAVAQLRSQTYSLYELDNTTNDHKNKGQIEDAVRLNLDALIRYNNTHNTDGIILAHINLANLLNTINKYNESLEHLDMAKADISKTKDYSLTARLYNEYGRSYALLKLYNQSNRSLDTAIRYATNMKKQQEQNELLFNSYVWKWSNFDATDQTDSLYILQSKFLKLKQGPLADIKIANRYIREKKHLDSAEFYLDKALASASKHPLDQKALALLKYGELHHLKDNNEKALEYYFGSLTISKKIKRRDYVRSAYEDISDAYKKLGDHKQSESYYKKFSFINDSINENEKEALHIVVKGLAKEKQQEKSYSAKILLFILIPALCVAGILFYRSRSGKQTPAIEPSGKEKAEMPELQDEDAERKNEMLNRIIHMAKKGDPFFITLFKQSQPEFYEKLKAHAPDLTEHDIKFCIYLRLNLSTKQICKYENITVRAIETKKYRIKKKLKLKADVRLINWLLEL